MEDSHSPEEISQEQKPEAGAPLDEVDYKRLARLAERTPTPMLQSSSSPFAPSPSAKKAGAPLTLITAALFLFILLGGGIYFLSSRSSQSGSPVNIAPTPVVRLNQNTQPATNIKREMIAIPGGTFQMGRSDGLVQEGPAHAVTVGSFYMDNTEVTNADYADFVRETGHTAPSHFVNRNPVAGQEQWPVTNVSIADIEAFAAWRSKRDGVTYRLPTEEEWEYAARNGEQNSLYPWGDVWETGRAATKDAMPESLLPVGSFTGGKNRWGVMDLIGNVWEWTSSKASYYQGSKPQLQPEHKDWYIIRGGSIMSESKGDKPISSTYRDWIKPTMTSPYLGFRLVRSDEK